MNSCIFYRLNFQRRPRKTEAEINNAKLIPQNQKMNGWKIHFGNIKTSLQSFNNVNIYVICEHERRSYVKCYSKYTFSLCQAHSDDSQYLHWFYLLLFCHIYSIDSRTCDLHILNSLGMKKEEEEERRFSIWNAIGIGTEKTGKMQCSEFYDIVVVVIVVVVGFYGTIL